MTLAVLVYSLCVFWAAIHGLHRVWVGRTRRSSILPSLGTSRRNAKGLGANLNITLNYVYLRIDTRRFNDIHDRLAMIFTQGRRDWRKRAVYLFYNLGNISGALGMLIAIYLVLSTTLWAIRLQSDIPIQSSVPHVPIGKRDFDGQQTIRNHMDGTMSRVAPVQLMVGCLFLWWWFPLHVLIKAEITDTRCNSPSVSSTYLGSRTIAVPSNT